MAFQRLKQLFRAKAPRWHFAIAIFASITALRYFGLLEGFELFTFDFFLKNRPPEEFETNITIIGIDEPYLENVMINTQDTAISNLIERIYDYNPAIVGLDFFFSQPLKSDRAALLNTFKQHRTLIGSEKIFDPNPIDAPVNLSGLAAVNQIGFNDFPIDKADERIRRVFIGASTTGRGKDFRESFSYKIARIYLEKYHNIDVENGFFDSETVRFDNVSIPRISINQTNGRSNYGGYIAEHIDGVQTLINFRSGDHPFRVITASSFIGGNFSEEHLRGKIVLIGKFDYETARTLQTIVASNSLANENSDRATIPVYGIEFQAHSINQIIGAILSGREMLWSFPESAEYLILVVASFAGFLIGKLLKSSIQGLLVLGATSLLITTFSYLALVVWGLWLPIVPAFLGLSITGITYIAFYHSERSWQALVQERDRALKALRDERQRTVEWTFAAIHSGPLQTLSDILRHVRDRDIAPPEFLASLESLNREIREVGEHLRQEIINPEDSLYLSQGSKLNLTHPLHELFYEVYDATLKRDFPEFKSIKVRTVAFDPVDEKYLTVELKRRLCRFLAELLCNVGKHARGTTRLSVICQAQGYQYTLTVIDNGIGLQSNHEGDGTRFCRSVASLLKGKFTRRKRNHHGTICELSWSVLHAPFLSNESPTIPFSISGR